MSQVTCPNCQSQMSASFAYCSKCGHPLASAASTLQPPQSETRPGASSTPGICPRCGHAHTPPLPTNCQACGYRLSASEQPTTSSKPANVAKPTSIPPKPKTARAPRKINRRLLGLAAIGLLIVIVAAVGMSLIAKAPSAQVSDSCEPFKPGDGFELANQRGLTGELGHDSYFKAGEEYVIANDAALVVPDKVTLIIEPGARVKFGRGAKLVVNGKLQACGTGNRRILFTADTTAGEPGYWAGLELRQANTGSVLGYATLEFAGQNKHAPLWIEDSQVRLVDLKFDTNQWYALSLDAASFPQTPIVLKTDHGPQGWEIRGGTLTQSQTWKSDQPLIVNGVAEVADKVTLTLPAGARVKFLPNSGLRVRGALSAVGTTDQNVIFTSVNDEGEEGAPKPAAGDWIGLQFVGRSGPSRLELAQVKYAGAESQQRGCLWLNDAAPTLREVKISNCAAYSISSDILSEPVIERLNLAEDDPARRWELRESRLDGVTRRTLSKIDVSLSAGQAILSPVLTGWISVGDKATLVLDSGVTLLFRGDRSGLSAEGQLQANGTEADPIVLTSWRDKASGGAGNATPGDWGGLQLVNSRGGDTATKLSHVNVRYAGAGDTRCVQLKNAAPAITTLSVSDCATYPLSSDALSQPALDSVDLSNNQRANQWEITESTLAERREWTWEPIVTRDNKPIVRLITGRIAVDQEAALTLKPGLLIRFTGNGGLAARGKLDAAGTEAEPIILTSWRDPEGGNTDSGAQPGDWRGVVFDSKLAAHRLEHVQIRFAGAPDQLSCLTLSSANPALTNVLISHCAYYPVSSDLNSEPVVDRLTLSDNQPADEWALRESKLAKGVQLTLASLLDRENQPIVRVATG